jgi:methionine-rich copper-binding protein CopC
MINFNSLNKSVMKNMGSALVNMAMIAFPLFSFTELKAPRFASPSPGTMGFGSGTVVFASATNPSADQSKSAFLNGFDVSMTSSDSRVIALATSGNGAGTDVTGGGSDAALTFTGGGTGTTNSSTLSTDDGSEVGITGFDFAYERNIGTAAEDFTITGKRDGVTVGTLALSVGHKTLASVDLTTPTTGSFANIDELVITPDAGIIGGWSIDDLVIVAAASANNAPTDIALNSTSINQSATGINATVGTLSTTDADGGDTHTYSLVSGSGSTDNASFNISGSTLRTGGALAAGTYDIRINANDGTDDFAEEFTVTVVDNVAPSAPSTPDLATSSDSGNEEHTAGSTSDNLTNDTTPTFEGTAEAGSTVKIISNIDGEVGSGIATGGNYSITTSALTAGAHTITATATDGSANTSSASSALSITIDTTSPTVSISTTSSNPTNDNPIPVTITFNSEADNMTENDITVVNGTTSNFVSPDSTSFYVDITPSGNGAVQVSLGAGTAFDRAGNANTVSNTLSLTYDGTAPAFSSVSPSSSSSVSNANVGYTLSEAIASGTVTFTRTGGSADGNSPRVVNLTGAELNSGVRSVGALTNAPNLVNGTVYTISFDGQDAAGNSATTVDVTNVTFDTTAPTLVSSNPADDATGFNISDNLTLTFSENIAFGTGSILVMDEKDGSKSFLIDAASPGTQASISGAVLTINPSANLDPSSLYSVQISPTAIDDLAGNGYAGIYNSTSYNFSTNFPPTVSVNNGLTMNQGATGLIDTGKLNATDTESTDITFTITTAATNGTLFVDTNPSNTYNAGDVLLSANATFTLDDLNNDKIRYTNSSGTSDSFVFKVSDPNGGELTNQTFNITLNDVTPPSITSLGLNNSNAFVEIFASEGLYSTNGGSGALEISDIDISISGGTATNPVITSLKQLNGTSDLVGGESNLRVNFTTTGVADGGETVTINFADGSSVFDVAGNAAAATQSNNTRILNDLVDPYITGVSLAADNSYIDVTFNEGVYEDNCGGGGLTAADFDLKISGGSASLNTISSVKQNDSPVDASASALSGGETTIRIFFSVTGTPDGGETLEVDLKANEVFDINGRTAIADQTANNTATMNDKAAPRISSIVRQSPTTSHTNADQVSWDITFSEVVSNVGPEDLTVLGTTGTVTSVSNPSGNTYRITISGGNMESLEGTITLGFVNGHVVKDAGGNALINTVPTGTWDNTYAIDNTAPAITSFTRKNPTSSLTSVSQLVFLATFSEDVTSVDLNDFAVTGLTGSSIAVSQLTASTYDVTVSGGDISTYSGVVGLNLSSPNITDLAGNALPITEPATDDTYSLDNTAPTITSIAVPSDGSYETGEHLDFTLTFSEVVNVDEGCVNPPALNITVGSNTRAAHYLSGTNSNSVKFRYTVQASDSDTDGVSINSFSVGDGVVYDAVGNSMVEDLPSNMPSTADVLVNICASATIANAGSDEEVCGGSTTLAANAASGYNETGAWSVVSGAGGSFSDVNSPTATFTGIRGASYTLRWTISNGICTNSTDDVVITFDEAVTANAGSDQNVCGTNTFLGASYSTGNTGSWSILSGAGGSITSPSSPFSSFSGVVGTVYTLQWTETNGSCSDNDTVKITFFDNPTPANAGLDKDICGPTALSANAATGFGETGTWSVVSGAGGSFSDANSPTATFTGTEGVNYTLRWTISNGVCPISSDDVVITVEVNDVEANAGSDQNVCGTQTFLGAVYSTGSTGSWSILSGAGGSVTTPSSNTSKFTGTVGTTYTLQWTENSGTCSDTDIVEITFLGNVTVAAAGADQETCNTSVTMAANAASGFRETGTWSVVSGAGGGFADANSPTSSFTGTKGVSYTLRWTISNGVCPISSDDVVVTLSDDVTANAGSDQNVCGTNTFLGASFSTGSTGSWSILSGAGGTITTPTSATSTFKGKVGTTYTLQWTENNGSCSDTDIVEITFFDNVTVAAAGADQKIDGALVTMNATLAGNTASGFRETGTWSEVAGDGNGVFSDANSPTSTFTGTVGVTYTLRWTISNGVCPISSDDVLIEFANNAGFTITETASSTEVDESGSTDTFDVVLDSEPASDVVINVSSGSTSEVTVDQSSLTFTSGNWNVPQTVTVQGVDDSKVDTDKSVKITLSIDDAASHDNYDAVIDQSVSVINENTTTASVTAADVSIAEADGTATVTFTLDNAVEGGLSVDVSTVNGTATGGVDFSPITAQTIMFDGTAGETETLDISITADAIVEADETITVSMSNLTPVTVSSTDIDITDGATVTINNDDQATVTIADASGAEADGVITLTATLDNAVDGGFFVELNTADVTALSTSDYTALISQKLTFLGTAGEQQTFTITPTDDNIEESTETLTVSMRNISAGTVDKNNIDITDGATITITDEDDNTAPVGYSVTLDDALIGSAETATSTFTFAGAEIGTTYNYMVNSDNGGTKVAGSGTIATATDQVTLTDLSGLNDGTLTLSVTLTDASSNVGTVVTAQATIDQTMEATLSPADDAIDVLPDAKLSMDFGENVYKGTGNITIAQSSNDEVLETIDVTSSNVVVNGSEVIITPTNLLLPPSTEFYVSIEIGAITDDAGNNYAGATSKTAWTFTTIAAPVVTATTVPTADTYAIGDKLIFETSFTLPVTITGTPSLPITIGTETKAATLSGKVSESNTATFTYTITEGDLDTDGITVGSAIDLNGATIVDEFGTDAILTLNNTASTANVNVDGIRAIPTITSVVSDLTNAAFTVTVTYDEPVSGLTAEDLNITNGTADNVAVVTAGLVWTADITPTADGATTVAVAAAAVTDAAGNTSVASATEIATTFDGTAPAVTSIARVESERVNTGVDKLNFTVKFSENVTGVDASDFQVATTGTATASVNTVTQVDGKTYTVNVNGISGEGTIGLNAKDDDNIIDAATNALASAFTGEVYTTNFVATDIALSTASIQENNAVGAEIGAFSTTDADAGDSHTYTLVSGTGDADNASFTITGNKLLAAEVFDFETKNSYSIRVKTDDSFGGTYEEVFTIEIINEAEAVIVVTGEGTFDETILGLSATKSWTIENRGEAATEVRIISSSQGFSVNPGSVQLNPGDTKNISAVFTPTEAKVYNGVVVFNYDITNNIQDNVLEIGLSGEGVIVTGVDNGQISEEQIGVFPNPASTYVTIDLSELSGMPLNIQMISPTGVSRLEKEGYDKSELTIDVTNFESGLYIIQFSNERSLVRKKVLIRK